MTWPPPTALPSSSVAIVIAGLEALGIDRARCAAELGIEEAALVPGGSISARAAVDLINLASQRGGPHFGVRAGARIPQGALGLIDYLCGAAPTGRDALRDLIRYFRLVAAGATLRLEGEVLALGYPPGFSVAQRRLLTELVFALLTHRLTARGVTPPTAVALPGEPSPAPDGGWPWAHTSFGAELGQLRYTTHSLDLPLSSSDPSLRALLDRYAATELQHQPCVDSVQDQVAAELIRRLPGSIPPAAEIARSLGMSDRSLRRALHKEGVNFSEVRDRCLRRVAQQALRDPKLSIGEVGWLLGYSEPSAFHRAFRRWTGTTPEGFRQLGHNGS